MREIINYKGGRTSSRLAVTAATGIAAVNIGGITVHSWSGYSKFDKDLGGKLIGQRKKRRQTIDRWKDVDTLIVDESMPPCLWRAEVFLTLWQSR